MWSGPAIVLAIALMALGSREGSAQASETYACADGTSLHVTAQNRAEMNDHPCVKDWFQTRWFTKDVWNGRVDGELSCIEM